MQMLNKSLISVSALLALGALGCGDDAEATPGATPPPQDAGVGGGTAMDAGFNVNGCNTLPFVGSVKVCTQTNGQNGYQTCVNNMPEGECKPISLGGDGGTNQLPFDASVLFDGSFPQIEAGTLKCPSGTTCSALGAQFGIPISACVASGQSAPPSCTTVGQSCMIGSETKSCSANPIYSGAKTTLPGAEILLSAVGLTENWCFAPCN